MAHSVDIIVCCTANCNIVGATGKNPDVDTSFLPDRDREEEDARLRCSIAKLWAEFSSA